MDQGIQYKTKFNEVEQMIENTKKLGFDTKEYEDILHEIDVNIKKQVKEVYLGNKMIAGRLEQVYTEGLSLLNKLSNLLEQYNIYFKVLNSCKYIDMKIKDKNMLKEELDKHVSMIIYNLNLLTKSSTIDYEQEKHIVEKAYDTSYNVIKLELIITGYSQLYRYIKEYDVNLSFFNKLILEDISKLDLSDKEREYISTKIYELDMHGITSNYFDLELIKLLLSEDEKTNFKNSILNRLKELEDKITNNNSELSNIYRDVVSGKTKTISSKVDYITAKKSLMKKLISTALTFSVIITGGIGIERLMRKCCTTDFYSKQIEIYSTLDDTTAKMSGNKDWGIPSSTLNGSVYVREYEPWQNQPDMGFFRNYKEYNVSHINLDTAYDYYEYGLENFGIDYTNKIDNPYDRYINMNDIILYQDNYIEVKKVTYEYLGKDLIKGIYFPFLILLYLFYIAVLFGILEPIEKENEQNGMTIKNIIDNFKNKKGNYQKCYQELQVEINKLMELINSNDEYRNKFNELYEENKFLLDNPEELYERINNLTINQDVVDSKKLIRELKEKKNY